MSEDVEMNDVAVPLLKNGSSKENIPSVEIKDPKLKENNDIKVPDVDFIGTKLKEKLVDQEQFTGLSKEELEKYAQDPFWVRLRKILFALFWLIWAGMLIAAILIVVWSPKCPTRPKLQFWEKKTGYWVDTSSFVDSNGDGHGDIDGLITRLDYIQKQVGAGYLILDPVFSGQYSEDKFGSVKNFKTLDSLIGKPNSLPNLIKESRKRGIEIVLAVDFNALYKSSSFLSNGSMPFHDIMNTWVARDGSDPKKKLPNGNSVYTSMPDPTMMIDLNLQNEEVLKEIKESVKLWLDIGIRGFLLTNVAFYVENRTAPAENFTTKYNFTKWYSNGAQINTQIFSTGTHNFLREIRQIMNDVAKKTDKPRLLIIDAGNVGYGLTYSNVSDKMLQYLDGPDKVVDMVVGREFLRSRGWNFDADEYNRSSVFNYLSMTHQDKRSRIALTSATSTSLRTRSVLKLSAPFLLPGNPIIYFGTELGVECDIGTIKSIDVSFYPKKLSFPLDNIPEEWPMKCNHMIMPWDNTGNEFSSGKKNFTDDYLRLEPNTVQILTGVGRPESLLQLHQKLIKIRAEPSLQWGTINMFHSQMNSGTYEIFIREAEGFPKIIVALIRDDVKGKVFSFSSVCAKVLPLLVYPSNPYLPENKEIEAKNIYLQINNGESVHVFKCVA